MSMSERDQLRAIWQQMARKNTWLLVTNEEAFLDDVTTELRHLEGNKPASVLMAIAVRRTYSVLLYRGIQARSERAASELWLALVRLSLKGGVQRSVAEDLAQETIARVLEKLAQLRSPQGFLAWAITILGTVERDYRKQGLSQQSSSVELDPGLDELEIADKQELVAEVEQALVSETIVSRLRAALPNDLERIVLLRIILFDDKPRDVARDLGLPLYRTRQAKFRALERLRADVAFKTLLRSLAEEADVQYPPTGVENNDE